MNVQKCGGIFFPAVSLRTVRCSQPGDLCYSCQHSVQDHEGGGHMHTTGHLSARRWPRATYRRPRQAKGRVRGLGY